MRVLFAVHGYVLCSLLTVNMMRPHFSGQQITLLLTVVSFLGGIAANVATGALPEAWQPYLWLAWPLTGFFLILTIVFTVWPARAEPDLARQQMLLLNKVTGRVQQALDDKLPDRRRRIDLTLALRPDAVVLTPRCRLERPGSPPPSR
jgi:hypothetical protein